MAHPMISSGVTRKVDVPEVEEVAGAAVIAETFAGRIHVEWDPQAAVTPLGQLPFFAEFLKLGALFDAFVSDCPLRYTSPNAPSKRDVLGTIMLSVLAGCWRYAHMTSIRNDRVNPILMGMTKVVSEDSVRGALKHGIDRQAGEDWLRFHLLHGVRPLLGESWILDVDTTVKPLYGRQEGAEVGYNPSKRGRPSHSLHTYIVANVRLVLDVEVHSGKRHASRHSQPGLWRILDAIGRENWPALLRGDNNWGSELVMQRCEQEELPYLFRLRLTSNVSKALKRKMMERDWVVAGHGWEGKEMPLRLDGWSRSRRVVLLRRRRKPPAATLTDGRDRKERQLMLSFPDIETGAESWEYGALVTSLDDEILTLGQLYRDRGDCENVFDETKNQWGWGGFTTRDMARCQLMARIVALVYNWWSLFARLADPDHHREAITSRPLMMHAIARRTEHAGRTTLTITSVHGDHGKAQAAYRRIARFFATLRSTAEQLASIEKLYRILSEAMKKFLKGRLLRAPPLLPAV